MQMGSRGENVRWNSFLSALPCPQGLGSLFTEVSKKQIVEGTKEEPSLVGFILKLNLVYLTSRYVAPTPENLDFYCCGFPCVKSTGNLCDQEAKASISVNKVYGAFSNAFILAKINEQELPVHRFVRELVLVLSVCHMCIMRRRKRFDWTLEQERDEVDEAEAEAEAFFAREMETWAKLERKYRAQIERKYMAMQGLEASIKDVKKVN